MVCGSRCGTPRLLVFFESGGRSSDEMIQTGRREASNLDREDTREEKDGDLGLLLIWFQD